jgi:hypothetical protein
MKELSYTLLSDGTSDRAFLPLLTWLLHQRVGGCAIQAQWADLGRLPRPPKRLVERIQGSLELYPCDLLCVHRDAEAVPRHQRAEEIRSALQTAIPMQNSCPHRRLLAVAHSFCFHRHGGGSKTDRASEWLGGQVSRSTTFEAAQANDSVLVETLAVSPCGTIPDAIVAASCTSQSNKA